MWSRVLENGSGQTQPVIWRKSISLREPGAALSSSTMASTTGPSEDAPQLQARLSELAAAAKQQAQEAYNAGLRAGQDAARQAAEAEVRSTVEALARSIAEISGLRIETVRRAESDTVRLSIEIARRILHRELSVDPSALEGLIKAAIEKLQSQEVHRVRVHPDQAAIVRSCLERGGRSQVEVMSDPVQPKGAVVFEINRGALDASVETQLAEIERGLVDHLGERT
jgi:flagellar assembly protein FliH